MYSAMQSQSRAEDPLEAKLHGYVKPVRLSGCFLSWLQGFWRGLQTPIMIFDVASKEDRGAFDNFYVGNMSNFNLNKAFFS